MLLNAIPVAVLHRFRGFRPGMCQLVWLAPRLGFVDAPGSEAHKQQSRSVPYGGGVAVGLALVAGLISLLLMDWEYLDGPLIYISA